MLEIIGEGVVRGLCLRSCEILYFTYILGLNLSYVFDHGNLYFAGMLEMEPI